MQPKEVSESYDKLAEYWNSDHFNRTNGIQQHIKALDFVTQKAFALDVGCGSSGRIINLLIEHGYQVEGLDVSMQMIELAKARHPNIIFHHADICSWGIPRSYNFISAWDSIWHVPLHQQEQVVRKLLRALVPGGVFIFTTGGVDEPSELLDSAMGEPMYHGALGINKLMGILIEENCVCRHLEYDQYPENHVYIIVQKLTV